MNATITIKTDMALKMKAQETAKKLGMSLNELVTNALKGVIKTKTIYISEEKRELSTWAKRQLKVSEKNRKEGKGSPIFNNTEDTVAWLKKQGV